MNISAYMNASTRCVSNVRHVSFVHNLDQKVDPDHVEWIISCKRRNTQDFDENESIQTRNHKNQCFHFGDVRKNLGFGQRSNGGFNSNSFPPPLLGRTSGQIFKENMVCAPLGLVTLVPYVSFEHNLQLWYVSPNHCENIRS